MSNTFDTHCHPQFPQYDKDREEVLGRAREAGIRLICVGTDLETSKQGVELAKRYNGIWATVGLHPNDAPSIKYQVSSIKDYKKLLSEDKVIAIGEVGLDYYRTPELEEQEKQKEVFGQFLDLAIKYDKPVVIHSRDASKGSIGRVHSDVISILNTKYLIHNTSLRGVAHSFTGTLDEAKKYLDLNFCLGFNGIITFAHQYNEVVKYVPIDRILLETDAPYLTPQPYRGQRNEPLYVKEVAKKIAELKDLSVEEVTNITTQNSLNLFKISL